MHNKKTHLLSLLAIGLSGALGCQLFGGTGGGGGFGGLGRRDGSKEVKEAKQNKDLAKLQALCNDESLGDPNSSSVPMNASNTEQQRIQWNRQARREACIEAEALKGDQDDGNCQTVAERFEKSRKVGDETSIAYYGRWASRLAKCNHYGVIFEKIAHVGDYGTDAVAVQVLSQMEKDGLPVVAEFLKYAETHQGPKFLPVEHAGYAANHLGNWLQKGGHSQHCDLLAKALVDAKEAAVANILFYFSDNKCRRQGQPLALSLLASDSANFRRLACANLADLGDATALRKVKILAETDSYNVVQEQQGGDGRVWGKTVYPVRDACTAAAGKIQLRM